MYVQCTRMWLCWCVCRDDVSDTTGLPFIWIQGTLVILVLGPWAVLVEAVAGG